MRFTNIENNSQISFYKEIVRQRKAYIQREAWFYRLLVLN